MAVNGLDALVFGVEDMAESRRFLTDWGLTDRSQTADALVFETQDGGEIVVRDIRDSRLPPAVEPGSTVRELIWGAESQEALELTLAQLALSGWPVTAADGLPACRDPDGLTHKFRVSRRRPFVDEPTPFNSVGVNLRVDRRAPVYQAARPISIGHVVLFAGDYEATRAFFLDGLGFVLSDQYPGFGSFMRCQLRASHHDAFVMSRPGQAGLAHAAFNVSNLHEVCGGGLEMSRRGWETEMGPGRHPISSALFWYVKAPLGAPFEYYTDADYCTEAWEAREFERKPELFAEWAVAGGIDSKTRRQTRGG